MIEGTADRPAGTLHLSRRRARRAALSLFRVLPRPARRGVVRAVAPSFTTGAVLLLIDGPDVLLLRQRHHRGLTLPGGLLNRGETPAQAVVRELAEELSADLAVGAPSTVLVEPSARRVDVVYTAQLAGPRERLVPDGEEVLELLWRPLAALRAVGSGPDGEPVQDLARDLVLLETGLSGETLDLLVQTARVQPPVGTLRPR